MYKRTYFRFYDLDLGHFSLFFLAHILVQEIKIYYEYKNIQF